MFNFIFAEHILTQISVNPDLFCEVYYNKELINKEQMKN